MTEFWDEEERVAIGTARDLGEGWSRDYMITGYDGDVHTRYGVRGRLLLDDRWYLTVSVAMRRRLKAEFSGERPPIGELVRISVIRTDRGRYPLRFDFERLQLEEVA